MASGRSIIHFITYDLSRSNDLSQFDYIYFFSRPLRNHLSFILRLFSIAPISNVPFMMIYDGLKYRPETP